ncbi:hypothetical protein D9599_06675 [Roseomonas sp. KE2513]|uniref:hypothetical protein n=1 Tax=Roseomonas sp. KE2513 TaxID=2479202 RepID=UPI0018DFCD10|nr:hypothetical protein [Roseomonas sp. KE2513]MBI0535250.1 hypothetical protein [Roseomonas sp. KE2513]
MSASGPGDQGRVNRTACVTFRADSGDTFATSFLLDNRRDFFTITDGNFSSVTLNTAADAVADLRQVQLGGNTPLTFVPEPASFAPFGLSLRGMELVQRHRSSNRSAPLGGWFAGRLSKEGYPTSFISRAPAVPVFGGAVFRTLAAECMSALGWLRAQPFVGFIGGNAQAPAGEPGVRTA